jgi:hypothetical protein
VQTSLVWFLSQNTSSKASGQVGPFARAPNVEKDSMMEIWGIGNNIMIVGRWRGDS